MSLKAIRRVKVETATLDTGDKTSSVQSTMSVFSTVDIDSSAGYGQGSNFNNIRVRMIVAHAKHSCEMIDYISQRFLEYDELKKSSPLFGSSVAPANFVSFLKTDMLNKEIGDDCADPYDFLEETSPVSPFSTKAEVVRNVFKDKYSYSGDGKKLPPATVMFDAPLVELVDPKIANVLTAGDYSSLVKDSINLDPIHFKFNDVNITDVSQLSIYAYAYELPEDELAAVQISLTTGMTPPTSYNFRGKKTIWRSITLANPMIGIGYQINNVFPQTTTESAPDGNKLIVLNTIGSSMVFMDSLLELQRNLYNPDTSPVLKRRRGIRDITKKDNFFSDFWITKDSDENHRFMFAFDIQSYLAEKSYFSYLYKREASSRQIIDGTGLMTKETPSYIMNMEVKRVFIDPPSLLPINNLGTGGYSTELEPTPSYPTKRILNLHKLKDLTMPQAPLEPSNNRYSFYEGKDILNTPIDPNSYNDGAFRYGAKYTIYDGSVIFVRQALKQIMLYRNIMRDLYDKIIAAPSDPFRMREDNSDLMNIYDDNSGFLNVRSNNVILYSKYSGENQTLINHLTGVVENYREIMSSFLDSSEASMYQYFRERLLSTESYLEVAIIEEMVRYMDMFIHLLYRRLSEFFPTNPLGRDIPSLESNDFESRGLLEYRAPFLRDEHYFDNKVTVGKDYGFGVDYVMETEADQGIHNGLARVEVVDYKLRTGQEVGKYFTPSGEAPGQSPNLYDSIGYELGDATDRYLTPYIVRVPNREVLYQVSEVGQSIYPLNKYAQLFVDTYKHKSLVHPGGLHDPIILDSNSSLERNDRLYNSVVGLLQEQHEVSFQEDTDFIYPSLEVITGQDLKTTEVDDLDSRVKLIKDGPKLIPTLIGGNVDLNSASRVYIKAVDTSLTSEYYINQEGYTDSKLNKDKDRQRPIKLPFAIFGELSVDPQIDLSVNYQEKMFNSLKNLSNRMGLDQNNITQIFSEDLAGTVPAPVKSMLVLASSKESNALFGGLYDATRPTVMDQDSNTPDQNVTVKIFGDGETFQATGDPMKVYAKFMAFWMNYKQTVVVEYLSGFGNLKPFTEIEPSITIDPSRKGKLKLPSWRPLTKDLINQIEKDRAKILCRSRTYTLQEYIETLLPETQGTIHALMSEVRKSMVQYDEDIFDFPVYNEYFIIGPDDPIEEEGISNKKTSENECHEHSYEVDAKGNGWTSEAQHPDNSKVKHRHQILNFVVQTAQSDCYPQCETKYGVKGAAPHIHELLGEEMTSQTNARASSTPTPNTQNLNQVGVNSVTTSGRGGY